MVFSYVKGFGEPNAKAGVNDGKLPRLNDGLAAENDDDVTRCVWIDARGSRILCDLQKTIDIGAVNTFSWHLRERAPQHFVLWGSAKEKPDAAAKDLKKDWTQIAVVDTIKLNDGGKHGSTDLQPRRQRSANSPPLFALAEREARQRHVLHRNGRLRKRLQWLFTPMAEIRLQQEVFQKCSAKRSVCKRPRGHPVLEWLDKMSSGKLPPVLHLDLIEAADMRTEEKVVKRMEVFRKGFPENDKLAAFRTALLGWRRKMRRGDLPIPRGRMFEMPQNRRHRDTKREVKPGRNSAESARA